MDWWKLIDVVISLISVAASIVMIVICRGMIRQRKEGQTQEASRK